MNWSEYNDLINYLADRVYADFDVQKKIERYYHLEEYRHGINKLLRIPLPNESAPTELSAQASKLEAQANELYREFKHIVRDKVIDKLSDDVAWKIKNIEREKWEKSSFNIL